MIKVHSKALNKTIDVKRIIAKIEGKQKGPTVVFFAGLHGNEPAGVFALHEVINTINKEEVRGNVYAISGNLSALSEGIRFIDKDLNRVWTQETLDKLKEKTLFLHEEKEQFELYMILKEILEEKKPPFYFIDIHTTSSKTLPFITINDALINRKFSRSFPTPIVLGIEEYLEGPLLTYLNKLGYVSLGFESGQHDDPKATTNAISFINLTLAHSGSVPKAAIADYEQHVQQLQNESNDIDDIFQITHLYSLTNQKTFKMKPGFKSFQFVEKGKALATHNGKIINSPVSGQLFMPLYQARGKEGFFLIKKIKPFFLKLSVLLRTIRVDNLLVALPGVSWQNKQKGVLRVNLKTARFMAKPIFHLLGYRNKTLDKTHILLYNRERVAKTEAYKNIEWYKKH